MMSFNHQEAGIMAKENMKSHVVFACGHFDLNQSLSGIIFTNSQVSDQSMNNYACVCVCVCFKTIYLPTNYAAMVQIAAAQITEQLLSALQYDNQLSVRYLIEWQVVLLLSRYPSLIEDLLLPCLSYVSAAP